MSLEIEQIASLAKQLKDAERRLKHRVRNRAYYQRHKEKVIARVKAYQARKRAEEVR